MVTTAKPLISVVMAVFRPNPIYFSQAVESVLAQTLGDFEFVIIEDPSTTFAEETLARWQDVRVRHIRNLRRTSLVEQRNRGLSEARGDLVAVIDADDIWEPEKLEKQLAYLRAHPDISVIGSHIWAIDQDGQVCGGRHFPLEHELIVQEMRRSCPVSHSSTLFAKEVVLDAGGYRFRRAEDYELWCRLAKRGVRFATHPEPLVRYRIHSGQQKAAVLMDLLRAMIEIKDMYWRDQRTLGDQFRCLLDMVALLLPPYLLMKLLRQVYYNDRLPNPTEMSVQLTSFSLDHQLVACNFKNDVS